MEKNYINNYVFERIKYFNRYNLSREQKLLIDKLIPNEELIQRYYDYGLCEGCKQPNTGSDWCHSCNSKHFQRSFKNWTSGSSDVNKLIQESQLNAKHYHEILEWIEYDRFENIEYLAKGGFGTTYKATWKDGFILRWDSGNNQWKKFIQWWNSENNQWIRYGIMDVALKCLHNSQDITDEFLRVVRYFFL